MVPGDPVDLAVETTDGRPPVPTRVAGTYAVGPDGTATAIQGSRLCLASWRAPGDTDGTTIGAYLAVTDPETAAVLARSR